MYIFGHLALGLVIGLLIQVLRKETEPLFPFLVSISAMIPDMIDKPIGSLLFQKGRWIAHSLLFCIITGLVLYQTQKFWLSRINSYLSHFRFQLPVSTSLAITIGTLVHLLGDQPGLEPVVLLWPLLGQIPETGHNTFLLGFQSIHTIITEVLGLLIFVVYGIGKPWNKRQWTGLITFTFTYLAVFAIAYTVLVGWNTTTV